MGLHHHHGHGHHHHHGHVGCVGEGEQPKLVRMAAYAAVGVALSLVLAKSYAWFMTQSMSMQGSLFDSILDGVASLIMTFAIRLSQRPADDNHRFGHAKAESLAVLAQAAFITLTGGFLVYEGIERLMEPETLEHTDIGIYVMIFATVLTSGLVAFQRYVITKTNSLAIKADSAHYQSDLMMNIGVIASLLLNQLFGYTFLDTFLGFAVGLYLIYTAWQVSRASFDDLMDRELPEDARQKIIDVVKGSFGNVDIERLRTRSAGQTKFIYLSLLQDPKTTIEDAHQLALKMEEKIREVFPQSEVIIHTQPKG